VGSGVAGGASLRGAVGTGVLDGGPDGSVAVPHAARREAIATPAMVRFMTDSMGVGATARIGDWDEGAVGHLTQAGRCPCTRRPSLSGVRAGGPRYRE
jgi:hypothetical protein